MADDPPPTCPTLTTSLVPSAVTQGLCGHGNPSTFSGQASCSIVAPTSPVIIDSLSGGSNINVQGLSLVVIHSITGNSALTVTSGGALLIGGDVSGQGRVNVASLGATCDTVDVKGSITGQGSLVVHGSCTSVTVHGDLSGQASVTACCPIIVKGRISGQATTHQAAAGSNICPISNCVSVIAAACDAINGPFCCPGLQCGEDACFPAP